MEKTIESRIIMIGNNKTVDLEAFYTTKETADLLECSPKTVERLVTDGSLKRRGKRKLIRYKGSDIIKMMG